MEENIFRDVIIDGNKTDYIMYYSGEIINTKNGFKVSVYPIDKYHRYCRVRLYVNEKPRTIQYHRLRMMVFYPVENMDKLQVNHIDGDRNNNEFSNLEWVTPSENVLHAFRTGLSKPLKGESNPKSVLTENKVREICERLQNGDPTTKIAKDFNVSSSLIQAIRSKIEWTDIVSDYTFPEKRGNTRLTEQEVVAICEDILFGLSNEEIAIKFGIKPSYVKDFRLKRTWTKITQNYNF